MEKRIEGWSHTWQPLVDPRQPDGLGLCLRHVLATERTERDKLGEYTKAGEQARASGASGEEWTRERPMGRSRAVLPQPGLRFAGGVERVLWTPFHAGLG